MTYGTLWMLLKKFSAGMGVSTTLILTSIGGGLGFGARSVTAKEGK